MKKIFLLFIALLTFSLVGCTPEVIEVPVIVVETQVVYVPTIIKETITIYVPEAASNHTMTIYFPETAELCVIVVGLGSITYTLEIMYDDNGGEPLFRMLSIEKQNDGIIIKRFYMSDYLSGDEFEYSVFDIEDFRYEMYSILDSGIEQIYNDLEEMYEILYEDFYS
jgi:hypothetical protein